MQSEKAAFFVCIVHPNSLGLWRVQERPGGGLNGVLFSPEELQLRGRGIRPGLERRCQRFGVCEENDHQSSNKCLIRS